LALAFPLAVGSGFIAIEPLDSLLAGFLRRGTSPYAACYEKVLLMDGDRSAPKTPYTPRSPKD
jgi:hypothetical protein